MTFARTTWTWIAVVGVLLLIPAVFHVASTFVIWYADELQEWLEPYTGTRLSILAALAALILTVAAPVWVVRLVLRKRRASR